MSAVIPNFSSVEEDKVEVQNGCEEGDMRLPQEDKDLDECVPKVDLSHLNAGQQEAVMKVLMEDKEVFSQSDTDTGDITDFKMDINLTDNIPVEEAYWKIPRNLYA